MKRYVVAVALMVISIALSLMHGSKGEAVAKVPVRFAMRDIPMGESITEEQIRWKAIDPDLLPPDSDWNVEEGYVAAHPIAANTIIHRGLLRRAEEDVPKQGYARTALRLTPEQALCWKLRLDEEIDLLFVDEEGKLSPIGKATVKGWFDQQMKESESSTYLLIEAKESIALEIIKKRDLGRIEIMKKD